MAADDVLGQPARQGVRGLAAAMERRCTEIILCALRILIPPLAERRHVVGGDGADGTVRIMAQAPEAVFRLLRHRLYLE